MAGSFSSPLVVSSSSSSSSSTVITITRAKAAVKGEAPDGGGPARRTRMSGIPVAPQQRAHKVGPVGEPRSLPSRLLYLRRAANFTRDIQNGAAASPARRPRFEAAAGHCSALHASICKN